MSNYHLQFILWGVYIVFAILLHMVINTIPNIDSRNTLHAVFLSFHMIIMLFKTIHIILYSRWNREYKNNHDINYDEYNSVATIDYDSMNTSTYNVSPGSPTHMLMVDTNFADFADFNGKAQVSPAPSEDYVEV